MRASDDFLAGVEHGERQAACREIGLRLEHEGQIRKRVRQALDAERRRARLHTRRVAIATGIVVAIMVYNLTLHGLTW